MAGLGKLARFPVRPSGVHSLGGRFHAEDCVCCRDARSPESELHHPRTAIAVQLDGMYVARAAQGEVLVGTGAMLLKVGGTTHHYRHLDDAGDRSIVFGYDADVLEDIARSFGRRSEFRGLAVPASPHTAAAVAQAAGALAAGTPEALEDAALAVVAAAVAADRDHDLRAVQPGNLARVARAARYIAAHHADDCSLATLAEVAGTSEFHFARMFRAITGQTPRQYVIAVRLRAAAHALVTTQAPVTQIALSVGFADLSNFTTSFRRAFGSAPGVYRRIHS